MKEIILTQNQVAIIDDEDYSFISKYKWCAVKKESGYYARRNASKEELLKGYKSKIYMHREIMAATSEEYVDHKNHNTLDNQKNNLRKCTASENCRNARMSKNNTSGFKGVSWHKNKKKWVSSIKVDGKSIHLGVFDSPIKAARTYDEAALQYFGEFAKINLMEA